METSVLEKVSERDFISATNNFDECYPDKRDANGLRIIKYFKGGKLLGEWRTTKSENEYFITGEKL